MSELTSEDRAVIDQPVLAHIATVMADGSPQLTPVWVDRDGDTIVFNTAKGRAKHRNLVRDPRIAVSIVDPADPMHVVYVRGRAEIVEDGADAHIDRLAKKYLGQDTYPWRGPGEQRVIVRVNPGR